MRLSVALAALLLLAAAPAALALAPPDAEGIPEVVEAIQSDPNAAASDPVRTLEPVVDPQAPEGEVPGGPRDGIDPGFADRVRTAFQDGLLMTGLAALAVSALGLAGFGLVTRYIPPKEALKNPQRSMLYGFVRGNPGVHLKKLSEEFGMKTSSILWHIRKLESAELVRSERANGYRVFYPTEGGVAVKNVSRAITALQNPNARALFEHVHSHPGRGVAEIGAALGMHVGTVRWHLRKLKEFQLVEELVRGEAVSYFATPLGHTSLQTLLRSPDGAGLPAVPLVEA
ncbi:MAG TPA: helix-turn-helix domain-containing protein [Candidatus Thermoplasmatota archaeon]|nr:helix-turn-helix domain-containing protein [Candidatus Thermoplasmatota archaeon]